MPSFGRTAANSCPRAAAWFLRKPILDEAPDDRFEICERVAWAISGDVDHVSPGEAGDPPLFMFLLIHGSNRHRIS